jgi:hypothetical protein
MTQNERIKELFEAHQNQWIPCYEVAKFALQYNTRISELRGEGMNIENKTKTVDGQKHSWFRYVPAPIQFINNQAEFVNV